MSEELKALQAHIRQGLQPLAQQIDRDGFYPEAWLRRWGALGGWASLTDAVAPGNGPDLAAQIALTSQVGAACGATAFAVWCQSACIWYLHHSRNQSLRQRFMGPLVRGELLAGTGMSNTVKHLGGIEKHWLKAEPVAGGYRVTGGLPWVSNLGADHLLATAAQLPNGGYVMFMLRCDAPGVTLRPCPQFCALEGTRTLNLRLDEVMVADQDVLAQPDAFDAYLARIKPGFILLQQGMALGVTEASLALIRDSLHTPSATNVWLDDQPDALQQECDALWTQTQWLARQSDAGQVPLLAVLRTRLQASELALRAAQSAALHAGARGFLLDHGAQRRMREALFVAIVTPALKQLRHEIARLQALQPALQATPQSIAQAA